MSNPLFGMFGNQQNPMTGMMQKFRQFQQSFRGDPNQQIQQLMNSGKISQDQYNRAVQMANQFKRMIGIK